MSRHQPSNQQIAPWRIACSPGPSASRADIRSLFRKAVHGRSLSARPARVSGGGGVGGRAGGFPRRAIGAHPVRLRGVRLLPRGCAGRHQGAPDCLRRPRRLPGVPRQRTIPLRPKTTDGARNPSSRPLSILPRTTSTSGCNCEACHGPLQKHVDDTGEAGAEGRLRRPVPWLSSHARRATQDPAASGTRRSQEER